MKKSVNLKLVVFSFLLVASAAYSAPTIEAGTGANSTKAGIDNEASGEESSAFGFHNKASGKKSLAFGYNNEASEEESLAFGFINKASGIIKLLEVILVLLVEVHMIRLIINIFF